MCYSAPASFTGAAALAATGIATLRRVREPRALLFACVPLLFSIHQAIEGVVWLGMDGDLGAPSRQTAALLFMIYAQGLLPLLMPLAVLLMEPAGSRRNAIAALTAAGAVVSGWDLYGLATLPSFAYVDHRSIAYRNAMTGSFDISLLYIVATCGSLLLSTSRVLRWYGLLNVVALAIVELVRATVFASVWCFYAALMSAILYWHFRQGRIAPSPRRAT